MVVSRAHGGGAPRFVRGDVDELLNPLERLPLDRQDDADRRPGHHEATPAPTSPPASAFVSAASSGRSSIATRTSAISCFRTRKLSRARRPWLPWPPHWTRRLASFA